MTSFVCYICFYILACCMYHVYRLLPVQLIQILLGGSCPLCSRMQLYHPLIILLGVLCIPGLPVGMSQMIDCVSIIMILIRLDDLLKSGNRGWKIPAVEILFRLLVYDGKILLVYQPAHLIVDRF